MRPQTYVGRQPCQHTPPLRQRGNRQHNQRKHGPHHWPALPQQAPPSADPRVAGSCQSYAAAAHLQHPPTIAWRRNSVLVFPISPPSTEIRRRSGLEADISLVPRCLLLHRSPSSNDPRHRHRLTSATQPWYNEVGTPQGYARAPRQDACNRCATSQQADPGIIPVREHRVACTLRGGTA